MVRQHLWKLEPGKNNLRAERSIATTSCFLHRQLCPVPWTLLKEPERNEKYGCSRELKKGLICKPASLEQPDRKKKIILLHGKWPSLSEARELRCTLEGHPSSPLPPAYRFWAAAELWELFPHFLGHGMSLPLAPESPQMQEVWMD